MAAIVDTSGALLIQPVASGGIELIGLTRGQLRKPWRVVVPAGTTPIGCVQCPSALLTDSAGSLQLVAEGHLFPVDLSEPLSTAVGVPGFALTSGQTTLGTVAGARLRLRLLSQPHQSSAQTLAARGTLLPLTTFQQAQGAIALSPIGDAVAVVRVSILRPGEWRLLLVRAGQVVVDRVIPARLATVEDHADVAACISPDGSRSMAVVPHTDGIDLLIGLDRAQPQRQHVTITGQATSCSITSGAWAITVSVPGHSGLTVVRSGRAGPVLQVAKLPSSLAQFCPGTTEVVSQGPSGAAVLHSNGSQQRLSSQGLAGCTSDGIIWTVAQRRVTWKATT